MNEFLNLSIEELFNYILKEIKYGWVDTKGIKHYGVNDDDLEYHLQTPGETLKRKIGICWDNCELLRYYFENNHYEFKTYFIYLYLNDNNCPSHAILVYKKDDNLIWIEPSQPKLLRGFHYYKTEKEFLVDMKKRFIKNGIRNNFFKRKDDLTELYCYEFKKPKYGIRSSEYYEHCENGKKIEI